MNKEILMNLKRGLEKRVMPSVLAGSLLFGVGGIEANAFSFDAPSTSYNEFMESDIKIFINGRLAEFNDDLGYPEVKNGRTYIPVRAVSETFNAFVYWDAKRQEVLISKHGKQVTIKLGTNNLKIAHDIQYFFKTEKIEMDAEAYVKNERTYIPVRALFEAYDMTVTWDGDTSTVYVVSDYNKNTECIDFKNYKVIEMKDLDLTKEYSKIMFDGEEINKDYLNVLKKSNEYRIVEDNGVLNIFSYQFLFDLNYLYKAHLGRKNNTTNSTLSYSLWSISEEEFQYVKDISLIDDRFGYFSFKLSNEKESGMFYSLPPISNSQEFYEYDLIVNEIIYKANTNGKNDADKVKIVNDEMKKIINYGVVDNNELHAYSPIYRALVKPNLAICAGYSLTFKYIMDRLGIDCVVVQGSYSSEPHSWNEVLIDGKWKVVDVTFNDNMNQDYTLLVDEKNLNTNYEVLDEFLENLDLVKYTLKLNNSN